MWDPDKELANVDEVLERKSKLRTLNDMELHMVHEYVFMNYVATQDLIGEPQHPYVVKVVNSSVLKDM